MRVLVVLFLFLSMLSAGALERIVDSSKLRVCIWSDYYGISFFDQRTQELRGIDVDLAKEFAKDLNVKLEFVNSSFATLISDIEQDKCDIAMFAIGITKQRSEKLRFSSPHLQSDIYAITTKSNKRMKSWDDIDKNSTIVAVAKGTLHEFVMKEKLKNAKLVILDTPSAREQEVESGRADVFMTDYPFSGRMLESTDWARLISPSSTYHITKYAWAIAKGDDVWFERVESFMKQIKKDGRLQSAAKKHKLDAIVVLD